MTLKTVAWAQEQIAGYTRQIADHNHHIRGHTRSVALGETILRQRRLRLRSFACGMDSLSRALNIAHLSDLPLEMVTRVNRVLKMKW